MRAQRHAARPSRPPRPQLNALGRRLEGTSRRRTTWSSSCRSSGRRICYEPDAAHRTRPPLRDARRIKLFRAGGDVHASAGGARRPSEEHGFGLREPPFENAPNPRFLVASHPLRRVVRLTYALRQRRGCAVLTGEPGCGKTLLTRAVVQRLEPSRYEIGLLTNPHGGRIDLLRQVLYELGVETAETQRTELLRALHELIVVNAQRGRETLIIVDDAQQVDDTAWFEELSSLLNIQTNERTLVTLRGRHPELRGLQGCSTSTVVSIAVALARSTSSRRPVHPLPADRRRRRGLDVRAGRDGADLPGQPRHPPRDQRPVRQRPAAGAHGRPGRCRRPGRPPRPQLDADGAVGVRGAVGDAPAPVITRAAPAPLPR